MSSIDSKRRYAQIKGAYKKCDFCARNNFNKTASKTTLLRRGTQFATHLWLNVYATGKVGAR